MAIPRQDKNTDPLPIAEDGDLAWTGMDMRAPPLVQPGFASSAKNMRVEDGVYWPRKGLFTPTWTRYASGDFPYRASYTRNDDAAWTAAYGTTYGSCIFSDPNSSGDTWLVRVCGSALLFFRETEIGRIIDFSPGLTVSGPVIIFQNFNTLVINRGGTESSLVWSGSFDALVTELVPSSVASGYAAVPPASYGLAWRERSVLLCDRDSLVLSRIADSTQYDTTNGIFYVNRGAGDTLRAAVPIGGYSLLVLKSQSLHVFSATLADLTDARLDVQAVEIRFDSPKTAVSADNKVWWLDRRGVRTAQVAQIEGDNKVRLEIDSTISDKIRPLVNRINWQYASLFSAAVTTDRIYFAVALDTQTTPQTLLVWNRVFNQWESYDQWNVTFSVQSLIAGYEWLKEPRLFAVSSTGYAACLNYGLGEDHVGWSGDVATTSPVIQEFTSRGYTAGTNDTKLFKLAKIQADTWNPGTLAVSAIYDGPQETDTLNGITRDRTKYFTARSDFIITNVNDDYHTAKRQDYSTLLVSTPASGYANWAVGATYSTGDHVFLPKTGRNYIALAGSVGELYNEPIVGSAYWEILRALTPGDVGGSWSAGQRWYVGSHCLYGLYVWAATVYHFSSLGTEPDLHAELWQDLGQDTAVNPLQLAPIPTPLSAFHSADINRDGIISAGEYNRVLELYNYRSGTVRTGEYHTDASVYGGYAPGPGTITTYHTADSDQNGRISLLELTRMIEYLNADDGAYHVSPGSEDGFEPGLADYVVPSGSGVRFEDFQQTIDRRTINRESVWCQVSVSNTQGAFKIRSLAIEAQPGNRVNSTS